MHYKPEIVCPHCGGSECVEKATVMYARAMVLSSSADDPLLVQSSPPEKPQFTSKLRDFFGPYERALNVVRSYIGFIPTLLLMIVTPVVLWSFLLLWVSHLLTGKTFFTDTQPASLLTTVLFSVLLMVPPVVLLFLDWKDKRAFEKRHFDAYKSEFEKWLNQFYCSKCDTTFSVDLDVPLELVEDEEGSEEENVLPEDILLLSLGVASNGTCQCGEQLDGVLFSGHNHSKLPYDNFRFLGFVCLHCGARYCKRCKDKMPGESFWSGWDKAVCLSCESSMGKRGVLGHIKGLM